MTRGRPVIGSDIGGIPDMISDDINGLLVPAADPVALAAAMMRLASDAPLRARLGEAGRESVAQLTPTAIGRRFSALYGRVLEAVG